MTSEVRRQHPANPNDEFEKTRYHVSLDTTSNCNLKCQHCWMDAVRAQGYDFAFSVMPFDLFKKICGDFVGHCRSFGLSCGFEPLLNKNFPEFVRHAVQAGLPDVHFYTNGTLMKEAIAEELVEIGPERIVLSLEGATEETFQDVRRGARLSQFVQAIDWLAAAKKRQGKEKPVLRLNWVVMPRNMPELPQLAALARDHGIQEVYLLPHIRWKETSLQEESVISLGLDHVAEALAKFTEECEAEGITVVDEMMTTLTPTLASIQGNDQNGFFGYAFKYPGASSASPLHAAVGDDVDRLRGDHHALYGHAARSGLRRLQKADSARNLGEPNACCLACWPQGCEPSWRGLP